MAEITAVLPLTDRQRRMLAYIEAYIQAHQYAPSIREITEACNTSSTSVTNYNLGVLEEKGMLTRQPEVSRSIVLRVRAGLCPTCGQPRCG